MPRAESRRVLRSGRFDELFASAVGWYADQAGAEAALRFVDAVEAAVRAIAQRPTIGSSYPAEVAAVPGLRSWRIEGFPYLAYYTHDDLVVSLWVILHGHRDLPAVLRE